MALFLAAGTGCEEGSDTEYKDPACTSSYNGPTKDIQIDAFCKQAYSLICNEGKSKTSPEVKQACELHEEMKDLAPSGYPSCPYCN